MCFWSYVLVKCDFSWSLTQQSCAFKEKRKNQHILAQRERSVGAAMEEIDRNSNMKENHFEETNINI